MIDSEENIMLLYVVSSVEDPEKVLDQAVEDMQNDLIKLRQAAAEVRVIDPVV